MTAPNDTSALLAQRSLLLAAAARDRRLTPVDVRVAVLLLDQIHRKTGPRFGLMWPSVAALAQEAGISRRWATECFKRLTGSGYIVPIDGTGGGRSITVTYRMGELNTVSSCRPQTVNPSSQFSAQNCEVQFLKVRTVVPQSMKWGSHDPIREPGRRLDTRALARESSPDFDRFWEAYPSRGQHPNPKQPARLKFNAAVKHGVDPGLIIAAAESYRAYAVEQGIECTAKVAQALTWLNQERYADRLQPAATQFGGGYRPMPSVAGG